MNPLKTKIINELKSVLKEGQFTMNQTVLEQHGTDESYHATSLPDVVVFPENFFGDGVYRHFIKHDAFPHKINSVAGASKYVN
jgi:hypothetical protein